MVQVVFTKNARSAGSSGAMVAMADDAVPHIVRNWHCLVMFQQTVDWA
jgi:hypothetical protein